MKSAWSDFKSWLSEMELSAGTYKIPGIFMFFISLGMLSWSLGYELDRVDMNVWDESLFALRAYRLYDQGSFLQNFNQYPGLYDHPSTKLPFVTLFQALSFFLLGPSVWSLRIVIVLIAIFCILQLSFLLFQLGFGAYTGLVSAFILLTSPRFLGEHMLRTGDHDAALAFFLLLASLYFYSYLVKGSKTALIGLTVYFLAALLTKNLLAGIVVPAWLIFAGLKGRLGNFLKDRKLYFAAFTAIAIYAGVIGLFEWNYAGFIDRMWNYELMGRYSNAIEGHSGSWNYYLSAFIEHDFTVYFWIWLVLVIFGIVPTKRNVSRNLNAPVEVNRVVEIKEIREANSKRWLVYLQSLEGLLFLITLVYGLLISASSTKLPWYHAALFPLMALHITLGLKNLLRFWILRIDSRIAGTLVMGLGVAGILLGCITNSYQVHNLNRINGPEGFISSFEHLKSEGLLHKSSVLLEDDFGSDSYFYARSFEQELLGKSFRMERNLDSVHSGEAVLLWKPWLIKEIESRYKLKLIWQREQMCYFLVMHRR